MLALLLAIMPYDEPAKPVVDTVQIVELNNFYCPETGRLIFTQLIFWDNNVVHWVINKQFYFKGNSAIRFFDSEIYREIRFKAFRVSDTDYDPEVEDRAKLQKELRRGLSSK